jgi:hypothetical protein
LRYACHEAAFLAKGSAEFRRWLFDETTVERLDFLLNGKRWMFDTHEQYTVSLVIANAAAAPAGHRLAVAGVADSLSGFASQSAGEGLLLNQAALGPLREVPLLPTQAAADLLGKLRSGSPFPLGAGRWTAVPVAEFHETNDRSLWDGQTEGWALWKGESFDQYDPHGQGARWCPPSDDAIAKAHKPNPGKGSLVAETVPRPTRVAAVEAEVGRARVAFRATANRLNWRSVIACLTPPQTFLTNKAPYLAFIDDDNRARASALAVLNALAFDWQARRFVERDLSYFILEGLRVPTLDDDAYESIASAAARLSSIDERFAEFAAATGVEIGPLDTEERDRLRAEIDARIAQAWALEAADLETIFADFSIDAIPEAYRQLVRDRFAELAEN